MASSLQGAKIAILVADGFEQVELSEPRKALKEAGAQTAVVSPAQGKVKGWNHTQWGEELDVDVQLDRADANDYQAILLPGGVMNPDKLRQLPAAVAFVKSFIDAGKPVAVICHGAWTLIEAGAVAGKQMTSYPSLRTDLKNAGAQWVDEEVVEDRGLISSRRPDDLPAFIEKMLQAFAESRGRGKEVHSHA
jgi:protease I